MKTGFSKHWPIVIILFLTAAVYAAGLDSRFLLDDFPNLSPLDKIESRGYLHYILVSSTGPSGRPVSLLSFALQHHYWPNDAQAFKLINLIIHLLNGLLIYAICLVLCGYTGLRETGARTFAVMVAGLWLVHPIHVNTVLYVVQRMTLLASFFTLAGIYVYLRLWTPGQPSRAIKTLVVVGILYVLCLVLAVFSKENGILLPLFILAMEFTLLANIKRSVEWRFWSGLFLILPVAVAVIYLGTGFSDVLERYSIRSYSMTERMMTEARILIVYLKHLLIPHPSAFSLFHDNYPVSRGLLAPPSTLYSIIGILFAFLASLVWRKRFPVVAFAVFWFLAAHLLESTYLNLELYFEHRNYLASAGILFLVVWGLLMARTLFSDKWVTDVLIIALYLVMAAVTLSESTLWSRPVEQALEWERRSPQSPRAISEVGTLHMYNGDYDRAISTFNRITDIYPDEIFPYLKEMNINVCLRGQEFTEEQWHSIFEKARHAKWYGTAAVLELDAILSNIRNGKCRNINVHALISLVVLLISNPEYAAHRAQLHEIAALLNGQVGEAEAALNNAIQAVTERPSPQRYLLKIRLMIETGRIDDAAVAMKEFKERYKRKPAVNMAYREFITYYEDKLAELAGSTPDSK